MTQLSQVLYTKTSDGKLFEDANEAAAHQAGLNNAAAIEAFCDKHYPKAEEGKKAGPGRSIAAKAIAQWLADQAAVEADAE